MRVPPGLPRKHETLAMILCFVLERQLGGHLGVRPLLAGNYSLSFPCLGTSFDAFIYPWAGPEEQLPSPGAKD